MIASTRRKIAPKDVAAFGALAFFVWTLVRDVRVPLLGLVDLGFHELGHLLTYPLPDLLTAIAGSFVQVAVPFGLAVYFFLRNDRTGSGLCLGWAGTSAADAARYIADAPYERLELLGNGEHDWAFTLYELDLMESAGTIATSVRVLGWLMVVGAAVLIVSKYVRSTKPDDDGSASKRPSRVLW